uniref:NADH-ubiquinone oxidoreductase chain 4L n=1 Tax=Cucujoidea sp. 2 KM-2017 TaxID=2219356 RepID=A0A346RJJ0_9CUCU|nr:NADH dehydrogenase subunit 4L [Cucujoidea sp. 2 KM-2017]
MMIYISMFMFMSGLMVFSFNLKHLLVMLLSLEFIVLSLYYLMYLYLSLIVFENFFSMIFLTMSVCEGALGLSLLILIIRTHGNDYLMTFSFLW